MNKSQKSSRQRMTRRASGKWAFNTRIAKQNGAKMYRKLLFGALAKAEEAKKADPINQIEEMKNSIVVPDEQG